ncbi:hypothetical protein RJ639_046867, partial [Escallonia herrerae]
MQLQCTLRPMPRRSSNGPSHATLLLLVRPIFSLSQQLCHYHTKSTLPAPSKWPSLLRAVVSTNDLLLGKRTHALIVTSGHAADRFLTNNLITVYSKCGSLPSARQLFDKTPTRDLVTWNSILAAYALSPHPDAHRVHEGFRIFRLLRSLSGISATKLTLAPVLKLCMMSGYVWASQAVHGYAVKIDLDWDAFVSGALVNIYSKFGLVRDALVLFNDMLELDRDVILWNVMLKAQMRAGLVEEAFRLFCDFHRSGLHPDVVSVGCVLSGLSERDFDEGNKHVQQVRAFATKLFLYDDAFDDQVILWNKTMSEYHQSGENRASVECFINMNRSN